MPLLRQSGLRANVKLHFLFKFCTSKHFHCRLIQIGEEFCGSASEGLQDSIRKQSLNYFHNYHRSKMDELRMFLENEGWEL